MTSFDAFALEIGDTMLSARRVRRIRATISKAVALQVRCVSGIMPRSENLSLSLHA